MPEEWGPLPHLFIHCNFSWLMFFTLRGFMAWAQCKKTHLFLYYDDWVMGKQPKQGNKDFPPPGHFIQLVLWDSKVFPGQLRDIAPPACPGSSPAAWWWEVALNTSPGSCQEESLPDAQVPTGGFSHRGGEATLLQAPPGWPSFRPCL